MVIVLLTVAGCVSAVEERSASTTSLGLGRGGMGAAEPSPQTPPCVMEVPGTGIRMLDVEGGIAVVFDTVTADAVEPLRQAVRALQQSYMGEHDGHAHDHSAKALELARQFRSVNGELPPHSVDVTDVERGARIEVLAEDEADVALLRTKMRAEIATMQRGVCPLVY